MRAIEEAEGKLPSWLWETVEKHTRGFLHDGTEYEVLHQSGPHLDKRWQILETWINEHIFRKPWQEGWMNAVGYHSVRDLAALRDEAYWSYCERQWKLSRPAVYPFFREWRKSSEHCSDEALDEFEVSDEIRELIKLSRETSPKTLRKTVGRYVDWQVFLYWIRMAIESGRPLPGVVEREVRRRCPGFFETCPAGHARNLGGERHRLFIRLIRWIEDREFALSKKEGWFPAVVYQARLHPRHSRVIDYWRYWKSLYSKHPRAKYPTFDKWRAVVDAYTFEPEGD